MKFWAEKTINFLLRCYRNSKTKKVVYLQDVLRKCPITYSHGVALIRYFEELGLVITAKEGRIRKIFLTRAGEEVAERLLEIEQIIKSEMEKKAEKVLEKYGSE
jgi:hypothetical protein